MPAMHGASRCNRQSICAAKMRVQSRRSLQLQEVLAITRRSAVSANEGREQEKGHEHIKAEQKGKSIWQLLADNKGEGSLAIGFLVALCIFRAAESLSGAQLRVE